MSEETVGKELTPLTEFEVLEQVDDQAIVQMMTGQAIKDYVYSFSSLSVGQMERRNLKS